MRWTWDPNKNEINKRKHKLSFETARLVFGDPLAIHDLDPCEEEERWQTIGMIGMSGTVIIFVVYTPPEMEVTTGEEVGRIISARKATPHEREFYENGSF